MGRDVAATTPSESSPPSLSKPKDVAAGIPAVISSLAHGITRMGTLASLRNFTSVNRFDGFDCPNVVENRSENERNPYISYAISQS